jgi:hypothetical protein
MMDFVESLLVLSVFLAGNMVSFLYMENMYGISYFIPTLFFAGFFMVLGIVIGNNLNEDF